MYFAQLSFCIFEWCGRYAMQCGQRVQILIKQTIKQHRMHINLLYFMSANTKQKIVQVPKSQISKPSINVPPDLHKQEAIQTKEENIKGCVFLFKCRMCHISFLGKYEILNHGKKDHNGKMFFEENGVLKRLWTFKCSICPSEFSLQGGTIDHIKRYHGIQKLYCCNDCQAYFTENGLNDHRIKVHQEENFTCPVCNVEFYKIEDFQTHKCSQKEATYLKKVIEKDDKSHEGKMIKATLATPTQATPTQATPIQTKPIQTTPTQATPTLVLPLRATPIYAGPSQVIPTQTSLLQATPFRVKPIQAKPLKATTAHIMPTQATPMQTTPTYNLETAIKTETNETKKVVEQDPLLIESSALMDDLNVCMENSTFTPILDENSAINQNIFEDRTATTIIEIENENGNQIEKDPLMIQSEDFLIPTETESNENVITNDNDAIEIKNTLMKNKDEIKEKETPISTEETIPENKNIKSKRTFPVEKSFLCPKCNITFKSKTFLESHMYRHLVHEIDDLKKPHPCLNCPKRFVKPIDLEKHIKKDHEEKNGEKKNSPKQVKNHNGKADIISEGILISGRSSMRLIQGIFNYILGHFNFFC